jgi:uncharacterized membrane protein
MKIYKILLVLSFLGLMLSAFLIYQYSLPEPTICLTYDSCSVVKNSPYSTLFGVKMPYYGTAYFIVMIGLLGLPFIRGKKYGSEKLLLIPILAAATFETYMTYLQFFVIKALCSWCFGVWLVSIIMLVVFVLYLIHNRKKHA